MTKTIRNLIAAVLLIGASQGAMAGEVTDAERYAGQLAITYYDGSQGKKISCTAFSQSLSPIGGATSYTNGGVARVMVMTPKKYLGKVTIVACEGKKFSISPT